MYKLQVTGGDDKVRDYTVDKWKQVVSKLRVVQEVVGIKSVSITQMGLDLPFPVTKK